MSTVEKLFVQIFERKKSIVERVKHQVHLFDQHLASKLLIDGITPPPWLLPSEPSRQDPDPNGNFTFPFRVVLDFNMFLYYSKVCTHSSC